MKRISFLVIFCLWQSAMAQADVNAEIRAMFGEWIGTKAGFVISLERRHILGGGNRWEVANSKKVDILVRSGFVGVYQKTNKNCKGINAMHPNCSQLKNYVYFQPNEKIREYITFPRTAENFMNGKRLSTKVTVGDVAGFAVLDITRSQRQDCDYIAEVRKEITNKTELGELLVQGNSFRQWYCFLATSSGVKYQFYGNTY